jgi:predicted type IV restriction endonuclease
MIVEHAKDKIKQQLNSIYGESILPTMRVYAHYEKETIEFKNVKTVYIQENYLMIVFEDDFKSIDLKDCKSTQY